MGHKSWHAQTQKWQCRGSAGKVNLYSTVVLAQICGKVDDKRRALQAAMVADRQSNDELIT